jgi:hypothetical protein
MKDGAQFGQLEDRRASARAVPLVAQAYAPGDHAPIGAFWHDVCTQLTTVEIVAACVEPFPGFADAMNAVADQVQEAKCKSAALPFGVKEQEMYLKEYPDSLALLARLSDWFDAFVPTCPAAPDATLSEGAQLFENGAVRHLDSIFAFTPKGWRTSSHIHNAIVCNIVPEGCIKGYAFANSRGERYWIELGHADGPNCVFFASWVWHEVSTCAWQAFFGIQTYCVPLRQVVPAPTKHVAAMLKHVRILEKHWRMMLGLGDALPDQLQRELHFAAEAFETRVRAKERELVQPLVSAGPLAPAPVALALVPPLVSTAPAWTAPSPMPAHLTLALMPQLVSAARSTVVEPVALALAPPPASMAPSQTLVPMAAPKRKSRPYGAAQAAHNKAYYERNKEIKRAASMVA